MTDEERNRYDDAILGWFKSTYREADEAIEYIRRASYVVIRQVERDLKLERGRSERLLEAAKKHILTVGKSQELLDAIAEYEASRG